MVVSQNKGSQYRPQDTITLIIGTPKKVPLILGNPHIYPHERHMESQEEPKADKGADSDEETLGFGFACWLSGVTNGHIGRTSG